MNEIRRRKIIKGEINGLCTLDIHEGLKEISCPKCEELQEENKMLKSLIKNIHVTGIMDWKEPITTEEMEFFIKVRKE